MSDKKIKESKLKGLDSIVLIKSTTTTEEKNRKRKKILKKLQNKSKYMNNKYFS